MKKVILLTLAVCLIAAGVAFAGVVGSYHDLGTGGLSDASTGTNQVCVFCHHPHRGAVTGALTNALLWNINKNQYSGSYAVYTNTSSVTMNAAGNAVDNVTDTTAGEYISYLCMGCHDSGLTANALLRIPRDATSNNSAITTADFNTAASNLGTTLEDDHPVNFDFSDNNGEDIQTESTVSGSLVVAPTQSEAVNYPLFGAEGWMQCATCHDVHRGTISGTSCTGDTGESCDSKIEFMNGDTANSGICTDCHLNK